MAFSLDANIPLLAQVGDPLPSFKDAFQTGQDVMQAPIRNQLLQQQAQAGQANQQIREQQIAAEQVRAAQAERDRVTTSIATAAIPMVKLIDNGDFDGALTLAKERRATLLANNPNANTADTDEAIAALESKDATAIQRIKTLGNSVIDVAERRGLIGARVGAGADKFSATTTSLPGGITVQTTTSGRKRVTDAGGKVLKGQDAIDAISEAEELKAQRQIDIAGGKRRSVLEQDIKLGGTAAATADAAKAAIKVSTDTFNRLEPLRANIVNIDDAISLIDEGATTGVIASKLPSIRSASIKLDTIQKKLGLDVISSTTFGALSEGEREFALSSALPTTLKGPELKEWLIEKKAVQQKLISQLSEAATFLGTPGNTIADFIELKNIETQEQERPTAQATAEARQGGKLMIDANGNRAMVFPDGTFQEVQ